MMIIVLLQLCMSKIVVVDDLGVTDKQNHDPEMARKVMNVLGGAIKNSKDTVLLSNSQGTKRIVEDDENKLSKYNGSNHDDFKSFSKEKNDESKKDEKGGHLMSGLSKPEYTGRPGQNLADENMMPEIGRSYQEDSVLNPLHIRSLFNGNGMEALGKNMYEGPNMQGYGSKDILMGYRSDQKKYTPFSFGGGGSFTDVPRYGGTPLEDGMGLGMMGNNGPSDEIRARRSFIILKMAQSKQKESMLQSNIDKLLQDIDQIAEKIQDTQKMKDGMVSRLHTKKNHLRNLQANIKEVEVQRGRTLALIRLSRNELLKLSKMMDDQRSKLALLEDEEKIFSDRIKKYDEEYDIGNRELQLDETRSQEIKRNIEELERLYNVLKIRNNELLNERNKESAIRNRLDLETERLDRNTMDFI